MNPIVAVAKALTNLEYKYDISELRVERDLLRDALKQFQSVNFRREIAIGEFECSPEWAREMVQKVEEPLQAGRVTITMIGKSIVGIEATGVMEFSRPVVPLSPGENCPPHDGIQHYRPGDEITLTFAKGRGGGRLAWLT